MDHVVLATFVVDSWYFKPSVTLQFIELLGNLLVMASGHCPSDLMLKLKSLLRQSKFLFVLAGLVFGFLRNDLLGFV